MPHLSLRSYSISRIWHNKTQDLVDQVAAGNFKELDARIEAAEGRPSELKKLEAIRREGEKKRRETKK